jgi:hypothetical protein
MLTNEIPETEVTHETRETPKAHETHEDQHLFPETSISSPGVSLPFVYFAPFRVFRDGTP